MVTRRTLVRMAVVVLCALIPLSVPPAAWGDPTPEWSGPLEWQAPSGTVYLTTDTPYSAGYNLAAADCPYGALSVTGLPAGLSTVPKDTQWFDGQCEGTTLVQSYIGTISGQPTAPTGPAGATVTFRLDAAPDREAWSHSFHMRVWQASTATVTPAQWSGSASVAGSAVRTAHTTRATTAGTTTAGTMTFATDWWSPDVALTPAAAGGTILTAPASCQGISAQPSTTGQLLYYGQASPTTAPVWKLAVTAPGTSTLRQLFGLLQPADAAAVPPNAVVTCASNQVDAAGAPITRIVAATPGSYTLNVGNVDTGTGQAPRWTTIDAPPLTLPGGLTVPGPVTTAPALSPAAPGEYDLAEVAADGVTWIRHFTPASGWGTWQSLGGTAASGVSLTSTGPGRLAAAELGTDGMIHVNALHDGVWTGWTSIGGPAFAAHSTPIIVATSGGNADLVALGSDNHPYRLHINP